MDVFKIFSIFIAFLGTAECNCYTTLYAHTFYWEIKHVTFHNNDYCTIYIRPYHGYSGSNYYLIISWFSLNVKGDMPTCSKDYVQVYLTRAYKSIGKFCSSNAQRPFTMYSYDGYAKIVYKSDSPLNGDFKFIYKLKSNSSGKLGSIYTSCPKQLLSYGTVLSQFWPYQYYPVSSPCNYTLIPLTYQTSYDATKIVFMDLDLNSGDSIELRGSNTSSNASSFYWQPMIYPSICSTSSIKTYTVYDRYIQIKFNQRYGSSSYRGFVAGCVSYRITTKPIKTVYATIYSRIEDVPSKNDGYNTIYIRPSLEYNSSNFYLQISWSSFNVEGEMPSCTKDYVQVYLTKSYKSIGKFCSDHASYPFTMYSHDGYAKIVYKLDNSLNGNFKFDYKLKSYGMGSSCWGKDYSGSSGIINSDNWPVKYSPSSDPCTHTIYRSSSYDAIKIVFMDLDLHPGDCIELRGSNTSPSHMTHAIDTRICSTSSIKTYTVYDRYIEIKFNRRYGNSSVRGFVAGYLSYDPPKIKPKFSSASIAVGIIVPLVFIGVVVFVCRKYRSRKRARNANDFADGIAAPATQTNTTATSTVTTNAAVIGDIAETSYPPSEYPNPTEPVASNAPPSYPVTSASPSSSTPYPTSYGTVPVYPSHPTGNLGYQTKDAHNSTGNPTGIPTGNQEYTTGNGGYLTGIQEFPTGNPGYPTETNTASVTLPPISNQGVTFSSHGDQQQPIVPPIDQNNDVPNVPPPAYPSVP